MKTDNKIKLATMEDVLLVKEIWNLDLDGYLIQFYNQKCVNW